MSLTRSLVVPAGVFALLASGCGEPAPAPAARIGSASTMTNGTHLNGTHLNGTHLNGTHLNGTHLNGTHLNGTTLGGAALAGVALDGSELTAVDASGATLRGAGLVGVQLAGALSNGGTLELRIDAVSAPAAGDDVWRYRVSYPADGTWYPLCGTSPTGAPVAAIPLAGTWDESAGTPTGGAHQADASLFTFACDGGAMAKCVDAGYEPWRTLPDGRSLADHHQACTRLIRADYCGDGTSFTVDGRPINLYDGIGVEDDTERWTFEAEWDPAGARCLSSQRVTSLQSILGSVASCVLARASLGCGAKSHFASGTLLMNEYRDIYINVTLGGLR